MSVESEHRPSLIEKYPVGSKIEITGIVEDERRNILQSGDPTHDRGPSPIGQQATVIADSSDRYPGVDSGALRVRLDDQRTYHVDENGQIIDRG